MNNLKFFKAGKAGIAMGVLLLATLTGCVGYIDGPHASVEVAPPVYVAPPVFVAEDDYLYYPGYDVYYSNSRHQYAYLEGGAWVSRPAPRGVSVNVLLASPSVRMDFHDSPANHHEATVRQYPKNWKPAGPSHGQKQTPKGGKRDERDERGEKNER